MTLASWEKCYLIGFERARGAAYQPYKRYLQANVFRIGFYGG